MKQFLVLSGNEITDDVREASRLWTPNQLGGQTDGLLEDGSIGVRRIATNLFRHGQCGATTDCHTFNNATVAIDTARPAPFSPQSFKVVTPGVTSAEGVALQTGGGLAAAAGTVGVGSVYVDAPLGVQVDVWLRWGNTDTSSTDGTKTTFTGTGSPALVAPASLAVAAGVTGDSMMIMARTHSTVATTFHVSHAMLESGQSVVAPYVATSGGATATHSAGTPQAAASLLSVMQGWVAMRFRAGWSASAAPNSFPSFFRWQTDGNNRLIGYLRQSAPAGFFMNRISAGGSTSAFGGAQFAAGDFVTVVFAWDANFVYVSVNGSPFVKAGNTTIPAAPTANIQIGHGDNPCDSDILWFACGLGTITDADAALIASAGDNPYDYIGHEAQLTGCFPQPGLGKTVPPIQIA